MRLADFIISDMERILGKWKAFAATRLPAAEHVVALELRDHAQEILEVAKANGGTAEARSNALETVF